MARGSYYSGFAPRDGQPRFPELWRGCIGAWAPCLGPSGLVLRDWSGVRRNGDFTLMDATAWQTDAGQYAVNFADLSNDRIDFNSSQISMAEGAVSLWFRKIDTTIANRDYSLWTHSTSSTDRIWLEVETQTPGGGGTSPQFNGAFNNNSNNQTFSSALTVGIWYHGCLQWRNGIPIQLWLNGVLVSSSVANYATVSTTSTEQIGNWTSGVNQGFGGNIDDVRRYTRMLSPNEIALLARRRGIAYEMEPPKRYSEQATAAARARLLTLLGVGR